MDLQFRQRKTINVLWGDDIKGQNVSLQVGHGDEDTEVRTGPNDGAMTVSVPSDFTGDIEFVVEGSRGGRAEGTYTVK